MLKAGMCLSLNAKNLENLRSNGVKSVMDFLCIKDGKELMKKTGLTKEEMAEIRRFVLAEYSAFPVTGKELYEEMLLTSAILPTGCRCLDDLLDGGLLTGEVLEFVGPPACGKTQLCMTLAISVAMETQQNVLYIDSTCSFNSMRILEILQERNPQLNPEELQKILKYIKCYQVFDIFEMLQTLHDIRQDMIQNQDSESADHARLLIVDSVASVVTPILGGRQVHGHALMEQLAKLLKKFSKEFALAVVITNNVVSDRTGSSLQGYKPALGLTWVYLPNTRIFITNSGKTENAELIATITKSSRRPRQLSTSLFIGKQGVYGS